MTGPGTRWRLPGGREAIEISGSTRDVLRVAPIRPDWPFPSGPVEVARSLCERMPSRRELQASVERDGEALL